MADQYALRDQNHVTALTAHTGTANTADTVRVVATTQGAVTTEIGGGQASAFGDVRTAPITPIFQHSFEYTVSNTELTTNTTVGSATVTQANGMAVLTTTDNASSSARVQSKRHARYRAGLGGLMRFTAMFTTPAANTEQFAGLADETGSTAAFKNGYMVGYNGVTFGFHRFQNDSINTVTQANWDDPLDGTGPSGMTLDQTKLNVFAIQFQYLGAGAITLYIESDTTGKLVPVHTVHYTNKNTEPSTHNPNFHATYYVDNNATTENMIVRTASFAYFIEGETKYYELHQPQQSSGLQSKASVTAGTPVFTVRNKASYASKTNFIDMAIENLSVSASASAANNIGTIVLIKNGTLGGTPAYADINTNNSVADLDTAGTEVTGGIEIVSFPLAGQDDKIILDLSNYDIVLAPTETLTLKASSSNSATINGGLLWKELF